MHTQRNRKLLALRSWGVAWQVNAALQLLHGWLDCGGRISALTDDGSTATDSDVEHDPTNTETHVIAMVCAVAASAKSDATMMQVGDPPWLWMQHR